MSNLNVRTPSNEEHCSCLLLWHFMHCIESSVIGSSYFSAHAGQKIFSFSSSSSSSFFFFFFFFFFQLSWSWATLLARSCLIHPLVSSVFFPVSLCLLVCNILLSKRIDKLINNISISVFTPSYSQYISKHWADSQGISNAIHQIKFQLVSSKLMVRMRILWQL